MIFKVSTAFTTLLFFVNSICCFAQKSIQISIAKFKDNKTAAISYTFDEGLKEHYTQFTPWLKNWG